MKPCPKYEKKLWGCYCKRCQAFRLFNVLDRAIYFANDIGYYAERDQLVDMKEKLGQKREEDFKCH